MDENEQPAKPSIEQRIDWLERQAWELEGQLFAANAALRIVISNSLDPAQTALTIDKAIERLIAKTLNGTLPDGYHHGLQRGKATILPRAADPDE